MFLAQREIYFIVKTFFYLGAPFRQRVLLTIEMTCGSGQAVHYIFAARSLGFQISNIFWAAKDAIPILCAEAAKFQSSLKLFKLVVNYELCIFIEMLTFKLS